jgi:stress-induced morphogen
MINAALSNEFAQGLHALSLKTRTPAEALAAGWDV